MANVANLDQVVKAALYLAWDDAAFKTGSIFVLDGEMTAQQERIPSRKRERRWAEDAKILPMMCSENLWFQTILRRHGT